jgi:ferredoxin-NADP reductase
MEFPVKIKSVENVTHDVKRFRCDKPAGYEYEPGQATEVSINKPEWKEEKRPFTFTSYADAPELEFVIKIYRDHDGVTNALGNLQPGDELLLRDVWGAIQYQGPGYFIAGGAGITPFIAILRQLKKENKLQHNKLFFSNKTDADIILKDELKEMLGDNGVFTITQQKDTSHHFGMINEAFLKAQVDDFSKHFYLCGPPAMVDALKESLKKLGASPEAVVFEK